MPVVIGAKPESSFRDPIGLLKDCHRRIERFLAALSEVSRQSPLKAGQRAALDTALRYFREAAPKHTADEEETLFPRLRSINNGEARAVLAKVDSLESDHAKADTIHAEVDRLGRKWLASGTLSPGESKEFAALVAELQELYRSHIGVEENEVFPVASALLEKPDRESMGVEMAARRGLTAARD
jgi:hemerythrin-like domain-containing protein